MIPNCIIISLDSKNINCGFSFSPLKNKIEAIIKIESIINNIFSANNRSASMIKKY